MAWGAFDMNVGYLRINLNSLNSVRFRQTRFGAQRRLFYLNELPTCLFFLNLQIHPHLYFEQLVPARVWM